MHYYATLFIGTPPKPFPFALSTSVNYILLDDINCYSVGDPLSSNKYNRSESSTYEEIDNTDKLVNRISLSRDTFTLCSECDRVHRQHFVLTYLRGYNLDYANSDGLIVRYR
jgi:hypothetical protein